MIKLPVNKYNPQKGTIHLLIILLAFTVIVAGVGLTYYFGFFKKQDSNNTQVSSYTLKGTLSLKEGTVEYLNNGTWADLEKGVMVKEGDSLQTGANSKAVIELDDGSAIRLDQNTQIKISTLNDQTILITQSKGRVYHRVNTKGLVYNVKSVDTLVTALGTGFSVSTDPENKKTEVDVLESKVVVAKETEEAKTEISAGQFATFEQGKQAQVTNLTEAKLNEVFIKWNREIDGEKSTEQKSPSPSPTPKPTEKATPKPTPKPTAVTNTFTLTAQAVEGGIQLNWKVTDTVTNGFKLCIGETANPSYPGTCEYMDSSLRSYKWNWNLTQGKTYHFRIGIYKGGENPIVKYSNNVSATAIASSPDKSFNGSIVLLGSSSEAGVANLSWTVTGDDSPDGFKLCIGEVANPTYPGSTCKYQSADARSAVWDGLTPGTYHFRIGAFIDGVASDDYSNDVEVVVN